MNHLFSYSKFWQFFWQTPFFTSPNYNLQWCVKLIHAQVVLLSFKMSTRACGWDKNKTILDILLCEQSRLIFACGIRTGGSERIDGAIFERGQRPWWSCRPKIEYISPMPPDYKHHSISLLISVGTTQTINPAMASKVRETQEKRNITNFLNFVSDTFTNNV